MESESIDYTDPPVKVDSTLNKKWQSPKRKRHSITGGAKKTHYNGTSPSLSSNTFKLATFGDDCDMSLNTSTSSVLSSNFGDQKDNMIYKHGSDNNNGQSAGVNSSPSLSLFFSPAIQDGNRFRGSSGGGSALFDTVTRSNIFTNDQQRFQNHRHNADGSMTTDKEDMTNSFSNSFLSSSSGSHNRILGSNGNSSNATISINQNSSFIFHHQPLEDSISRVISSVTTPIASPIMGSSGSYPSNSMNTNDKHLGKKGACHGGPDLSVDGLNINTTNSIIDETALSSISPVSSPGINSCFARSNDDYEVPSTNFNGKFVGLKASEYSPKRLGNKNKNGNNDNNGSNKNVFGMMDGHDLVSSISKINILNSSFEKEKMNGLNIMNKSGSNRFSSISNCSCKNVNGLHAIDCEWRSSYEDSDNDDDNEEIVTSNHNKGGTRLRFTPLGFNLDAQNDISQNNNSAQLNNLDRCNSRNSNVSSSSVNRMDTEEMNVFYEVGMAGRMSGLHVGKRSSKNNTDFSATGNVNSDKKSITARNDNLFYDSDCNDDGQCRSSYNSRVKVSSPVRVNGSMSFMEALSVASDQLQNTSSSVSEETRLGRSNQSLLSLNQQQSKRIVDNNNTINPPSSNNMPGSTSILPNLFDRMPGQYNTSRIRALSFDGYTKRSPSGALDEGGDNFVLTSPRSPTMMNIANSQSSLNNVDLTPLVSNGTESPTNVGAYNHFSGIHNVTNNSDNCLFSAVKSTSSGSNCRRTRRSNNQNVSNNESPRRGDGSRRRKSGSSIFNNSIGSAGGSNSSLSNMLNSDPSNGIVINSSGNISNDKIRPLPDQSAFEKSSNGCHIMSPTQSQDPVCPATPMRTPNWIHENSSNSIIIDSSDQLRSLQSDLLYNGPSLSRVNSLSTNKLLCENSLSSSSDHQIDVSGAIFDSENDTLRKSSHPSVIFHRDFENLGLLGSGTFADVYRVQAKSDGKLYAVKKSRRQFRSKKERDLLLKEVHIMKNIGVVYCKYVVQLIKAWQENGFFYAQIGLSEKGTVKDLMLYISSGSKNMSIPDSTIFRIVHDVSAGLNHMHALKVVHLDIKPANLLIDMDGVVKIGDFGMATEEGGSQDGLEGDSRYMAPELLNSSIRMPPADVFSLGLTLYEMCMLNTQTGYNYQLEGIYEIPSDGQFWHDVREGNALPLAGRSSQLTDIIHSAMIPAPSSRPSTREILALPYVQAAADPSSDAILSSNQQGIASSKNNSNLVVNLTANAIAGAFTSNLPPLQPSRHSNNATTSFLALQLPAGTSLITDAAETNSSSVSSLSLDRVTTPTNQVLSNFHQWKFNFHPNTNQQSQH